MEASPHSSALTSTMQVSLSGTQTMASDVMENMFSAAIQLASILGAAAATLIATAGLVDPGIVKGAAAGRKSHKKHLNASTETSQSYAHVAGQYPFDPGALATLPTEVRRTLAQSLRTCDLEAGYLPAEQALLESTEPACTQSEVASMTTLAHQSSGCNHGGCETDTRAADTGEESEHLPGREMQARREAARKLDWSKVPYHVPESLRGLVLFDSSRPDALLIGEHKFCRTCRIWRPPRAAHDTGLDVCVLQHDHYCTLIGNSVGLYNHPIFAAAAVCTTAATGLTIVLLLLYAVTNLYTAFGSTGSLVPLMTPSWATMGFGLLLLLFGRPLLIAGQPMVAGLFAMVAGVVGLIVVGVSMSLRGLGVPVDRFITGCFASRSGATGRSQCAQAGSNDGTCRHEHGASHGSNEAGVLQDLAKQFNVISDPEYPRRQFKFLWAYATRIIAQVPNRLLLQASASAVCMLVAAVTLFQTMPIASTAGEIMSETMLALRTGVVEASSATRYSSARLVWVPAAARPIGITETDLLIDVTNASSVRDTQRNMWAVVEENSTLISTIELHKDLVKLQWLDGGEQRTKHQTAVPHEWAIESELRIHASNSIKKGGPTPFVAFPVPVAGPQVVMHAGVQWASTPGRRILLVCGVLGALAIPVLAAVGLSNVPNPCSSIIAGLGLVSGNARQAYRARRASRFGGVVLGGSHGSPCLPCPSTTSQTRDLVEAAAAMVGLVLGLRMILPRLTCFDMDGVRGLDQCSQLDGGWMWAMLLLQMGAFVASLPFALQHPCMVARGQVTRDMGA